LAELYARALVTVAPSRFEQFGLVPLEAMACGCPIVTTRVGGFLDTVVPGATGLQCAIDDPVALAGILASYLRCPALGRFHGATGQAWVRSVFSAEAVYARHAALIADLPAAPVEVIPPLEQMIADLTREMVGTLRALSGLDLECLSHGAALFPLIADLAGEGCEFTAVRHFDRPGIFEVLFPLDLRTPSNAQVGGRVGEAVWADRQMPEPRLLAACAQAGLLLWRKETRPLAELPAWRDERGCGGLLAALRDMETAPGTDRLRALDQASVMANAPMGGSAFFTPIHPQAELSRILLGLQARLWPVPLNLHAAITHAAALCQAAGPLCVVAPRLSGFLFPRAEAAGAGMLGDDLSRLAWRFGPYNRAVEIFWRFLAPGRLTLASCSKRVAAAEQDDREALLGVIWLVVLAIYAALADACLGDDQRNPLWIRTLGDTQEAVRFARSIRSR